MHIQLSHWITPLELESSSKQIRIHTHKAAIIPHLSWFSLWLGFHTLAVYSHNDTCIAFNSPSKQILIEASNAQLIQQASGKALALGLHITVLILHMYIMQ